MCFQLLRDDFLTEMYNVVYMSLAVPEFNVIPVTLRLVYHFSHTGKLPESC